MENPFNVWANPKVVKYVICIRQKNVKAFEKYHNTVNVWNPNVRLPNSSEIQTFRLLDFRQLLGLLNRTRCCSNALMY